MVFNLFFIVGCLLLFPPSSVASESDVEEEVPHAPWRHMADRVDPQWGQIKGSGGDGSGC